MAEAKGNLPGWRKKKDLLWGDETQPEERLRIAEEFLAAGLLNDALSFFQRAGSAGGLDKVLSAAVDKGDYFLFKRCREALGAPRAEDLKKLAENAMALGKFMYAIRAFRELGDEDSAAAALKKLREFHPDSVILLKSFEPGEKP